MGGGKWTFAQAPKGLGGWGMGLNEVNKKKKKNKRILKGGKHPY